MIDITLIFLTHSCKFHSFFCQNSLHTNLKFDPNSYLQDLVNIYYILYRYAIYFKNTIGNLP